MSEWTYNTSHGRFCILRENVGYVLQALDLYGYNQTGRRVTSTNLSSALGRFSLECTETEEGDVVDIYLGDTSYFSEEIRHLLDTVIAPFVEDGSYLVFYGGGSDGCWAISYRDESEHTKGSEEDGEFVLQNDLRCMLRALKEAHSSYYETLNKKYGEPEPKENEDGSA